MKLEQLRQKLLLNNQTTPKKVLLNEGKTDKVFKSNKINTQNTRTKVDKKMRLIGITGSKGKSTVAYILHKYLQKMAYKSVLYSSISIDSPTSFNVADVAVENPLINEQGLLDAIEEAIAYDADFLVLEVNERAIHKGLTKDIPFDVRVITNISKNHNNIFYPNYVEIKKSFFSEIKAEDDVTCIFSESNEQMFDEIYASTPKNKVTYMSEYVTRIKEIDQSKVNFKLSSDGRLDTLGGLNFTIAKGSNKYSFESNLIMPYNAINLAGVVAILDTLNIFDNAVFRDFIQDLNIPGRDEIIHINGRHIIITTGIDPQLEKLKKYQSNGEINKIVVVSGAPGFGHKHWVHEFQEENLIKEREAGIKYAYTYIGNYADKVYITETDNGTTNLNSLMDYQASFLNNDIPYVTESNRKEAIRKAITDSKQGDVIYIAGRGNRNMLCTSYEGFKLHLDKAVVQDIIKELNWSN